MTGPNINHPPLYPDRESERLPLWVSPEEAEAREKSEFWRGVWTATGVCIVLGIASPLIRAWVFGY